MSIRLPLVILPLIALASDALAQTEFVRGHIYVAMNDRAEGDCNFDGMDWILRIAPESGTVEVFADTTDGLCDVNGLRFTPDGTKLLALTEAYYGNYAGYVLAFNPDGTSEIILDSSDGVMFAGSNALAFDMGGDLYLLGYPSILRYDGVSGPPSAFTDPMQSLINTKGALEFAPNGDLYFGPQNGSILRFTPDGQPSVFDTVGTNSLTVDQFGNVSTVRGGSIFRYDCGNPSSKIPILTGLNSSTHSAVAFSADASILYAGVPCFVYAVDPTNGNYSVIADLRHLQTQPGCRIRGMTVFAPTVFGDIDADGDVDLRDAAIMQNCHGGMASATDCSCVPTDLNSDLQFNLLDWNSFVVALN